MLLKEFAVRTNLQSAQDIKLGGVSSDFTLDTVNVAASVKMLVGDDLVSLNFETPYWVESKNSTESFCKVK